MSCPEWGESTQFKGKLRVAKAMGRLLATLLQAQGGEIKPGNETDENFSSPCVKFSNIARNCDD